MKQENKKLKPEIRTFLKSKASEHSQLEESFRERNPLLSEKHQQMRLEIEAAIKTGVVNTWLRSLIYLNKMDPDHIHQEN